MTAIGVKRGGGDVRGKADITGTFRPAWAQGAADGEECKEYMSPTVVIIDDDAGACDSLQWLVQSAGYTTRCYPSGKAYLDSAKADERPACVILDVHMSGMSGIEVFSALKARYPDIPIVFVTGYPDQALARKARALKAEGFFAKPLDTSGLLRQLESITRKQAPL
jgi:FixJ family two-component response regulator